MKKLGNRIKKLRENLKDEDSKWTQKYVADQIGVARVTYTAYENGTKTPPPDVVRKLANLFNVTTDYLLGRTDDPNPPKKEDSISVAFSDGGEHLTEDEIEHLEEELKRYREIKARFMKEKKRDKT